MESHKARLLIITTVLCATLLLVGQTMAHPLGNFSINRYARLIVNHDTIDLLYIVDRAEIPAFQNGPHIDTNNDNVISDTEVEAYIETSVPMLLDNIELTNDGKPLSLTLQEWELTFPAGQGDLVTERLTLALTADLATTHGTFTFDDANFSDRVGWREIVVIGADGHAISDATLPIDDLSAGLTDFPDDESVRPDEHFVSFSLSHASLMGTEAGTTKSIAVDRFSSDGATDLITIPELSLRLVAFALFAAFIFGAAYGSAKRGNGNLTNIQKQNFRKEKYDD